MHLQSAMLARGLFQVPGQEQRVDLPHLLRFVEVKVVDDRLGRKSVGHVDLVLHRVQLHERLSFGDLIV